MGQVRTIAAVGLGLVLGGCATRTMREHAAVMGRAGELLERETAAFAAARTGVVQLRQRSLVEQQAEVATTGQQNAATLGQWRVAGTDERGKRLALFEGVRAASEAMYEVRDQSLAWEESVLSARTALGVDRAALHRFVLQLVRLAQPGRFVDEVKFFAEYGAQVGDVIGGDLKEVLDGVKAAQAAADAAGDPPPTPAQPTNPLPSVPVDPVGPRPVDPVDPRPTDPARPTVPVGQNDPPVEPPVDPKPRPTGPGEVKLPTRSPAPATQGGK